jgi:hypothetical protein
MFTTLLMYAVAAGFTILCPLVFTYEPLPDFMRRIVNPWTVGALWIGALASYPLLSYCLDSSSADVHLLGVTAFMAMPGLALMGSWALWRKRVGEGHV